MEHLFFYLVALVAVVSGLLVVSCKNPVNSAISLIMTFVCLATFYVMLHAPFMAAIQIMVYAGAIIVLIIFVIMLLNLGSEEGRRQTHSKALAGVAGILIFFQLIYMLKHSLVTGMKGNVTEEVVKQVGHTEVIGQALFTDFLLPFEVASILLLVAIVGAVVIAKKDV